MYRLSKYKDFPMVPSASGEFYLHYVHQSDGSQNEIFQSAVLTRDVSEAKLFITKPEAEQFIKENELQGFTIQEA